MLRGSCSLLAFLGLSQKQRLKSSFFWLMNCEVATPQPVQKGVTSPLTIGIYVCPLCGFTGELPAYYCEQCGRPLETETKEVLQ